jgi:hypothetical protein
LNSIQNLVTEYFFSIIDLKHQLGEAYDEEIEKILVGKIQKSTGGSKVCDELVDKDHQLPQTLATNQHLRNDVCKFL